MSPTCPLCDSNKNTIVEHYGTIGPAEYESVLVRCDSCGHYFTENQRPVDFERLYSEGAYELIDTRGSLFEKVVSFDDRFIVWQLNNLCRPRKTLLDFGCGKGQFMRCASSLGWQVRGVETGKTRAEFGTNVYGLTISTAQYEKGPLEGSPFDAVTLFHVLEHLDKPKNLIKELVDSNLTQGGYFVIEVPLFDSLQSRIAGKRWIHLDPPLHISHFTKDALVRFVGDAGLRPVKIGSFSVRLGLLGMVQALMSVFGYKKMIITELKFRRTKSLMLAIALVLPAAVILELFAVLFNKGGVIRVYCERKNIVDAGSARKAA
jgi:SAM-dependent methyltransferase